MIVSLKRSLIFIALFLIFFQLSWSDQRGQYFYKKNYTPEPIPEYNKIKDDLPVPVLSDNQEWIDMYWYSWKLAYNRIKSPQKDSPFVSNWLDEAFSQNIFQWDTIFMIMFARYGHHIFPSVNSLDNFYCLQHESGYIGREYRESDGKAIHFKDGNLFHPQGWQNTINPPLFSWAEIESFQLSGDTARLTKVIPVLEKYAQWLEREGRPGAKNWEKNGRRSQSKHQLYWNTPLGSGMDNTPRPIQKGSGWIDMSAQMVIMYDNLAKMCRITGKLEKASHYEQKSNIITKKINKWCWNSDDGIYYDVDREGEQFSKKTAASFWPLLAEVADSMQAEKLTQHLKDPQEFWRPFVFPTLAADEPEYSPDGNYWRGSVWAPTNVMIIKGLEKYGYEKFAHQATEKYLKGMYNVFQNTGTVWENYAPEKLQPGDPAQPNFVGWTGCGPIQLLIENVLGFRPYASANKLVWHLNRTDRHGIKNLRFGNIKTTLICQKRENIQETPQIETNSNRAFNLIIKFGEKNYKVKVAAGKGTIKLK
ncbi:MAG TPA: trehalase family glycosidase [bacterium]|nr:trehalase family glycosidase [bacterium]